MLHSPTHRVWNSSVPLGVQHFSHFPPQHQTGRVTLHGSIPTSSLPFQSFYLSLWLFLCLSAVQEEAGGDGSSLRAITNPLCLYYWWEALEVFIAPSLLYWRDEQTDTFTGGERASRRPKLPQHIYQQIKPRRTETASLTTASTEQQMFANKMY